MNFVIFFTCLDPTGPYSYSKSRTERFNNHYEGKSFSRSKARRSDRRHTKTKSSCNTKNANLLYYGRTNSLSRPDNQTDTRRFAKSISITNSGRKNASTSGTEARRTQEMLRQYEESQANEFDHVIHGMD